MEQFTDKRIEEIRSDLFKLINKIEDRNVLIAIYTFLESHKTSKKQFSLDDISLEIKQEIRDLY